VRPWAHTISGVEVPTKQIAHQLVAEGNCVVKRRGGEQPEAKEPSVGDELDSAGTSDETAVSARSPDFSKERRPVGLRGSV